jgi:multicomponent Na+:H+ antiporter subunit B
MGEDVIIMTSVRIVAPFIQMFGLYIILHGHLTPGGGFQGGALFGASMILLAVAFGMKEGESRMGHDVSTVLESFAIFYVLIGLAGIYLGANFLSNNIAGIPLGRPGSLLSGGLILLLNIVIGFKVASTGKTLFYTLAKEEAR